MHMFDVHDALNELIMPLLMPVHPKLFGEQTEERNEIAVLFFICIHVLPVMATSN